MSLVKNYKEIQELRRLIPLNTLPIRRFEKICSGLKIEEGEKGSVLFQQGDSENEFIYILSGQVSLLAGDMEMETISGGSAAARFALAHQIPRKVSAVAVNKVYFVRIDAVLLNRSEKEEESTRYHLADLPEVSEGDWMMSLLRSPLFQRLPAANLQKFLLELEEIEVKAGQRILHQDEPGDYYYIIKKGRCALTRKPFQHAKEIKLAELKTCDTFGEDALLSEEPRNVSITMLTDGSLLRLHKERFLKLIKGPVLSYLDFSAALKEVEQGAAWLDVRTPDAFEQKHIEGSINMPFFSLRMQLQTLKRGTKYIVVCDSGKLSAAAAFILIRNAFDAIVLRGGLEKTLDDALVTDRAGDVPEESEANSAEPAEAQTNPLDQSKNEPSKALAQEEGQTQAEEVIECLKDQLASERRARKELEQEALLSRKELAKAKGGIQEKKRLNEVRAREASLGKQPGTLQAEVDALKKENTDLLHQLEGQKQANRRYELEQLNALQNEIGGLKEKNALLERDKQRAQAQVQALQRQVEELQAVRQGVARQIEAHQESEEAQSLRRDLEWIREQAASDRGAVQEPPQNIQRAAAGSLAPLNIQSAPVAHSVLSLNEEQGTKHTALGAKGSVRRKVILSAVIASLLGVAVAAVILFKIF